MSKRFNEVEKRRFVEQLETKSALQLAKEHNGMPSQSTILRWKKEFDRRPKKERPLERFTKTDRLDFVLKTIGLPLNEVRRVADEKGITLDMLDSWRMEYMLTLTRPLAQPNIDNILEENEYLKNRLNQVESILSKALDPFKHP